MQVDPGQLADWVSRILEACGVPGGDADVTAAALVEAELQGVASHGCMLLPMYVERLLTGSVKADSVVTVAEDRGALLVLDAGHGLGQVSAARAVEYATARARSHGAAVVAVRHAFHFGAAAYWSARIANAGQVGAAMCNTRPLMPAPGGAERVVGNNPLSFAFPAAPNRPIVFDMATSASAMGKIRNSERQGTPIPEGWATDGAGRPTTSAAAAIAGMLLPAAGHKGFGLAVMIDLLCGGVSGGSIGSEVQPLFSETDRHYDCSHWFLAISGHHSMASRAEEFAQRIRNSAPLPGASVIYAPGDFEREQRKRNEKALSLSRKLVGELNAAAGRVQVSALAEI